MELVGLEPTTSWVRYRHNVRHARSRSLLYGDARRSPATYVSLRLRPPLSPRLNTSSASCSSPAVPIAGKASGVRRLILRRLACRCW